MPPVVHKIFVLTTPGSTEVNRAVLQAVKKMKPDLTSMGVTVRVTRIPARFLSSLAPRLRAKGLLRFPALKTPDNVYLGAQAILGVYKKNVAAFRRWSRERPGPVGAESTGDPYRDYVEPMMRADADMNNDEIGDGDNGLANRVHDEMKRRQEINARRRPHGPADNGSRHDDAPAPRRDGSHRDDLLSDTPAPRHPKASRPVDNLVASIPKPPPDMGGDDPADRLADRFWADLAD